MVYRLLAHFTVNPNAAVLSKARKAMIAWAANVEANEPDVLVYEWHIDTASDPERPSIFVYETYKDEEAYKLHAANQGLANLLKQAADEKWLLASPKIYKPLERIAGFTRARSESGSRTVRGSGA